MGNTGSSSGRPHNDDTVDYGYLAPQGVYTGAKDWNHTIVTQLIIDRKLAPFYRPLEEYSEDWDDEQILAARRDPPDSDAGRTDSAPRSDSRDNARPASLTKRPNNLKEPSRIPEAALYRGAVECPICFLYYPTNINRSRCCDQAICTECFVQIKRIEPTTTHLVSEPTSCPYCVQDNFGVVYTPPLWRAGIGSEGTTFPSWLDSPRGSQQNVSLGSSSAQKRRRKSYSPDSSEVVTTDRIRPDWEAKLAAVRAAVARRANRRFIMRQVGDQLIPVGVTSSRVHALSGGGERTDDGEHENGNTGSGSRRRRGGRTLGPPDLSQLLGQIGVGGQEVEELMVMEAMRLSLLEHQEHQRKEDERRREEATAALARERTEPRVGGAAGPSSAGMTGRGRGSNSEASSMQGSETCDGGLASNRPVTRSTGQTTTSFWNGSAVDGLSDMTHSELAMNTQGSTAGKETVRSGSEESCDHRRLGDGQDDDGGETLRRMGTTDETVAGSSSLARSLYD